MWGLEFQHIFLEDTIQLIIVIKCCYEISNLILKDTEKICRKTYTSTHTHLCVYVNTYIHTYSYVCISGKREKK